jgi:hypothetical protein
MLRKKEDAIDNPQLADRQKLEMKRKQLEIK